MLFRSLEGMPACFAGLELDGVHEPVLVFQQKVVEAKEYPGPRSDRQARPRPLGSAGRADGEGHIARRGSRPAGQWRTAHRRVRDDVGSGRRSDHCPGEATDLADVHGIRGGGVELGIGNGVEK